MKLLLALSMVALLAACSIDVEHDEKTGDFKQVHVSIGSDLPGFGVHVASGPKKTETRVISDVHTIQVTGPVDVDVSIGATPSVVVEGDSKLTHLVKTLVEGDTLIVTGGDARTDERLRVKVVVRSLNALHNSGPGDVHVKGLDADKLVFEGTGSGDTVLEGKVAALVAHQVGSGDLDTKALIAGTMDVSVLGSGDVSLGAVNTDKLSVTVNGSGSVSATGTTKTLSGNVLGSGDLQLDGLHADDASLELMGAGDITVFAVKSVHARAQGTGDITIHGNPPKREVSGENLHFVS